MRGSPGIVLQARCASSRLPRKALESVGGRTILEQCLRRLQASGLRVVLATTDRPEDEALERLATRLGVPVYRGDADDVLARFVECASLYDIDPVVRATGDNPAVDISAPQRVLAALCETGADYVREKGLPYGADVEAIRAAALGRAAFVARDRFDREHVTTFIRRRRDLFAALELPAPAALSRPDLRVTVDTFDDLQHVRALYFQAGTDMPTLGQLIAAAGRPVRPEVA